MSFFQAKSYLHHWLNAVDEHSIHSPFFFDFYQKVVKLKSDPTIFEPIEKTRSNLLQDQTIITINDLGAKSNHFSDSQRTIAQVAQTSLNPPSICLLFHRLLHYMDCKKVVELGTSMGITSLYMAKKENLTLNTFEGNPNMVNIALTNFEYFETKNINLIEGNIDSTLPIFLQTPIKLDLVLMDANHRYEPTLRYFNLLIRRMADKGIIIIDDIYHSEEMSKAWRELQNHELIYASVDLFRFGVLFFDPALNKQHFVWSL